MTERLHLKLVTPAKTLISCDVDSVTLPTMIGQITILPGHAALVSVLSSGEATILDGEKQTPLAIAGGIVEVSQNTIAILADSAEAPSEIDVALAEAKASELAQKIAAEPTMDVATYTALMKELERERARMQVGKKWKNIGQQQ